MDHSSLLASAALELLDRTRLAPEEVERRYEQALDPAYWSSLHSSATATSFAPRPLERDETLASLDEHGYFAADRLFAAEAMMPMLRAIDAVRAADWPPVFAWVYDDFWTLLRTEPFRLLGHALFGDDVVQTGGIWIHFVPPLPGGRGWAPHVDAFGPNDPRRLTLWLALTDATLDNGCMYVVPKTRVPPGVLDTLNDAATMRRDEFLPLLQSARALPAPAGSLLGWEFRTIHWGSVCHARTPVARVSLSAELCARADLRRFSNEDAVSLDELPDHRARLRLIARTMATYRHWEPRLGRFETLAERLRT